VFLGAMLVWVYAFANPDVGADSEVAGVLLFAALCILHLGTGIVAREWIIPVLPPVAVGLAFPAGLPDYTTGEPWPIWFGLLVFEVIGLPLMIVGISGAKLVARRLRS